MTNAREFLDQIADTLRAKGREVEVSDTTNDYGTFVWLSTIAPHWYDSTISLSAYRNARTGRWRLGELKVRPGTGKEFARTTRTDIRIAADVYA